MLLASVLACSTSADDSKLRLITWADYAPADVIALFKKETGIPYLEAEISAEGQRELWSLFRRWGALSIAAAWLFFLATAVGGLALFGRRYHFDPIWAAAFAGGACVAGFFIIMPLRPGRPALATGRA